MDSNIFIQLAVVLSISSVLGFTTHRLRLPLLLAYLLAGVVISIVSLFDSAGLNILTFLPEIGIAFVLFLIGMELDLREVKSLGTPIIVTSLAQIVISSIAGYALAGLLGFNQTESVYLGLGLSFSSTIVVVKLLLEKGDLSSLYGKLSIGILLLEDLVAIIALMFLTVGNSILGLGFQQSMPFLTLFIKGAVLFILTFIISKYILPRLFSAIAKSTELLFLTALTWCFVFTSLAQLAGFSIVIGAFLAGVGLASSPYHFQIQGKIKPLRDFFVTLFFVYLGTQVRVEYLSAALGAVIILTTYTLVLKPLIFMLILGAFGFRKHTMFQTSINLSQISEFSLVILVVGVNSGLIRAEVLSVMAVVAVLSMIVSSILITYSKKLYMLIKPFASFFEQSNRIHFLEARLSGNVYDHVVVIGAHRVGGPVVRFLKKEKTPFIVLDFNPHIIDQLTKEGLEAIYGDVGDPDVLEYLNLPKAKLVISTATDLTDNEILLEEIRRVKSQAFKVVRATDEHHAKALKSLGADYVILPENVSGDFLVSELKNHWLK